MKPTYHHTPNEPSTCGFAIKPANSILPKAARSIYVGTSGLLVVTQSEHPQKTFLPAAVDADANTITLPSGHGFVNGQEVILQNSGGGLPGGLSANTVYFVVGAAATTIQLSATLGGGAINITTQGTGTHSIYGALQIVNAAVGYHPIEVTHVWAATTADNIRGM